MSASAGSGKANVDVKVTLTGLTPSSTYHYRLVASNGGGTTWGSDQSFTTGPNPDVDVMPEPQLVGIGTPSQFSVGVVGSDALPLKYSWLKTTSTKPVGTNASFPLAKTALSNAGEYYVRVTLGSDTVQTAAVPLGVISIANSAITVDEDTETTLDLSNAGPGLTFPMEDRCGRCGR